MDILDVSDRHNIDLSKFSHRGYILPGEYVLALQVNKQTLPERSVTFFSSGEAGDQSLPCLTPELVALFGLKTAQKARLSWDKNQQCLRLDLLPGITYRPDLSASTLYITLPESWLENQYENWDSPARWEEGLPGMLLDYNFFGQRQQNAGRGEGYNLSGNGTTGINLGPWRLRADWQGQYNRQKAAETRQSWDWSRFYAWRALPSLGTKLSMGEDYFYSAMFDGFRYTGASMVTDDSMLPPNLRGYAPEVVGIAGTNAKVIISQQGRVLREVQVASGPFHIQDMDEATSGQLDVRVEEQDGTVQNFSVNTSSIPYLTRPGAVRYKLAAGKPSDWQHHLLDPTFVSSELSWGINNGWSLYGGGIGSNRYGALALGVGRDLLLLGALAFDYTQSRATLANSEEKLTGGSWRLSYSKRFDDYDSQVTFAGYRFSEKNFITMNEFLDAQRWGYRTQSNKEMYTITFNQQFRKLAASMYLNYSHQTYWDRPKDDRYNLTFSKALDIGAFRGVSLSLSGYRSTYGRSHDDGAYLSVSIPWGHSSSVSYNGAWGRNNSSHQASYYARVNDRDFYQISSGIGREGVMGSGYYSHQGSQAQVNLSTSYEAGRYNSQGISVQGGMTATTKGAALHRVGLPGSTRILVDTDGVAGIPVTQYGVATRSNRFGIAALADLNSYSRSQISIDMNALPETAQVTRSVVHTTLTEGAIGYRRFEVISGFKTMAVIRLADGSSPPFGASVVNSRRKEVGIVDEDGSVWLSGMNPGEKMTVRWGEGEQCAITLPEKIVQTVSNLLLPCRLMPHQQ